MRLTGLDLFFWVAGLLGHGILLSVLWRKHRARQFPLFTLLIACYALRTISLAIVHRFGSDSAYFNTYWCLAIGDVILELLVLLEAASQTFCPAGHWAVDIRRGFFSMCGIGLILASALTWLATPGTKTLKQAVVIRGNLFASVLISELFVGMMVLSVTAGLPWKTHVARIVQGWGVYAVFGFLIGGLQSYFGVVQGTQLFVALSRVQIGAYLACLTYWIVFFERDAPQPRKLPDRLNRQLAHLHNQTAAVLEQLRPWRRHW